MPVWNLLNGITNKTNKMARYLHILAGIIAQHREMSKVLAVPRSTNVQKRTSNKSKLKQTKSKPSAQYKSTKPMKSKSTSQFRNKSNI
jgi:hypothetical protein